MPAVPVNKRILARHFSARASRYDAAAGLQRRMAEELCADLAGAAPSPRRILEIGCGTGFLTERLALTFPAARITAVDLAPGMIDAARRRLAGRPVEWVCADAEALELAGPFDVVASSATFQWLTRPGETLARLAGCLRPGGVLAAALFVEGTLQELFAAFRQAEAELGVEPAPHGPPLLPAATWLALMEAAGLAVEVAAVREVVRRYPSARDALHAVKAIGAGNASEAGAPPRVVRRMLCLYDQQGGPGSGDGGRGGVPATYRYLLVRARAPGRAARQLPPAQAQGQVSRLDREGAPAGPAPPGSPGGAPGQGGRTPPC